MVKVERTGEASGKTPTEVYEAAVETFEQRGIEVWKKRPIAWLAMIRATIDGYSVEGNLAARFSMPTSYILSLSSEEMTDEALGRVADELVTALNETLSA